MNYLILAETEFFALINGAGNGNNMEAAYNGFVESVISLCYGNGNSAMPQSQWLTPKTNCSTIIHCMKIQRTA